MDNKSNWVVVGRFGKTYGIKGYVTVHSFTEPRDNILGYTNWHAFIKKRWQPVCLLDIKPQSKAIIALVEGYDSCESAAALCNVDIAIQDSQLKKLKPGEYYWHQLIGMHVSNQAGESFGKVVDIMPTGSNDVLVVQGKRRHLIPYLPQEFVLDINQDKQVIIVNWDLDF